MSDLFGNILGPTMGNSLGMENQANAQLANMQNAQYSNIARAQMMNAMNNVQWMGGYSVANPAMQFKMQRVPENVSATAASRVQKSSWEAEQDRKDAEAEAWLQAIYDQASDAD